MEPEDSLPHAQVPATCPYPEYLTPTGAENYRIVRYLQVQSDVINDFHTYSYAACYFVKPKLKLSLYFKHFAISKQHIGIR